MRLSMRRRRELELRDAMADAWAAARVTGGQFRQLGPVYADRLGLAYHALRGHRRRRGRAFALTALLAAATGAAAALLTERALATRRTHTEDPVEAATPKTVAAPTPVSSP